MTRTTRPRGAAPAVGILTRAPEAGRSKTRLAAAIGADKAALLAEAMLLDTTNALRDSERWRTALFVEPESAVDTVRTRTGVDDARAQGGGSIGERMRQAAQALLADGQAPVVLVGSDIPTLSAEHIAEALTALESADVVFGPADDGGYYLIGLWEAAATLFDDAIPWSTSEVLAASLRVVDTLGWSWAQIRRERDLDTPADLATLRRHLERRGTDGTVAAQTMKALASIDASLGAAGATGEGAEE